MVDLTMTLLTFRLAKPALLLLPFIISAVSADAAGEGGMKTVTVSSFHPASDHPRRSLHHDGHGFYPQDSDSLQVLDEVVDSSSNSWRAEGKEVALSIAQDVIRIGPFAAIHR